MGISKITLNGVTQMDVTQDTVASAVLLSGYSATGADGEQVIGSLVAGGGDVETGTYSPSVDTTHPKIYFQNTHNKPPAVFWISRSYPSGSSLSALEYAYILYVDFYQLIGTRLPATNTVTYYGVVNYANTDSNGTLNRSTKYAQTTIDSASDSDPNNARWYVNESYFMPSPLAATSTVAWKSGYSYEWACAWV